MSAVFSFFCWLKYYNYAVLPWKIILLSDSFHGKQLPWVTWIFCLKLLGSQLGKFSWHLAAWVSCFFCWLKSYNCRIAVKNHNFPSKFLLHPAAVSNEDFWLKLLTTQVGLFSRHIAAVSAVVFFCWLKSYSCAVLPWKSVLFSENFHGTQLHLVPWNFWLKLLTCRFGQFSRYLAVVSVVDFFAD